MIKEFWTQDGKDPQALKSRFFFFLVLLLVFTIPLSQVINVKLLAVTFIFSLFMGDIKEVGFYYLEYSYDFGFYLLVLVIGLFISEDIAAGLRVMETNLSFIAIPVIFSRLKDFERARINKLVYSFITGLCLSCLICLFNSLIRYWNTKDIQSFFFLNFTEILDFQPTYYAYYLIFAIAYILFDFYYQITQVKPFLNAVIVLFLFLALMLTGGQTAFVSMLLIFSFFILKFIIEDKSAEKKMVIGLSVFMLAGMFLATLIDKGERGLSLNDAWDRLVLWESAVEATPNLLIGVGTGDYKNVLNEYYSTHNLKQFATESYNSHNQFIQLLFSNGFLGIIALIILIGRPLYLSVKNHSLIGILLIFPFLIYGMTEVFLGRYQGVVFFALVHQLSVLQSRSHEFSDIPSLH